MDSGDKKSWLNRYIKMHLAVKLGFSEISFLLKKFVVREIKVVEASESGEGKLVMGTD